MVEAGTRIGNKYELRAPLAHGGMGTVWRARHLELDVDVAVKLMARDLVGAPSAAERFRREARAAAQLRSPHVVQILDFGVVDEGPYLAMELLVGEDLERALARTGAFGHARAAEVVAQVAKALELAHAAKIVHRDLKPANIFLCRDGSDDVVKVLDFGVAKVDTSDGAATTTGAVLGSPLYMSPEQARGGHVDHRTDLWALAMVAYELVTGRHPLRGGSVAAVLVKICTEDTPPPSRLGFDLPGLDAFFARALARDVDARFPSASELARAVATLEAPVLVGEAPTLAARPSSHAPAVAFGRDRATVDLAPPAANAIPLPAANAGSARRSRSRAWWGAAVVALGATVVAYAARRRPDEAAPSAASSAVVIPGVDPVREVPTRTDVDAPGPATPPSSTASAAASGVAPRLPPRAPGIPFDDPHRRAATAAAPVAPSATGVPTPSAVRPTREPLFGLPETTP